MTKPKGYRYFHLVAMLFVATLLLGNTLAVKIIQIGTFSLPAGIVCFPLAYIVNDCLTEVYGYEKCRTVIWGGFICLALMALFYYIAVILPPASFWEGQEAFAMFFGFVPRIVLGSFIAFLLGSFLNSYVLSRMKIKSQGRHLWKRTIGSTIVGEGVDSIVFNCIAFVGIFPFKDVMFIALSGFVLKTLYEILMTPLTYIAVGWLKKKEEKDIFDHGADYSVFKV